MTATLQPVVRDLSITRNPIDYSDSFASADLKAKSLIVGRRLKGNSRFRR